MPDSAPDQAAGLRQLFQASPGLVLAVSGASPRRGAAALALASGFSALGRPVLVVDLDQSVPATFSERYHARGLEEGWSGRSRFAQCVASLDRRSWLLDGGSAFDDMMAAGPEGLAWLFDRLAELKVPREQAVILINADLGRLPLINEWLGVSGHPVLVTDARAPAITETYGRIKALAHSGSLPDLDLCFIVDRTDRNRALRDRLVRTASRFLALDVGSLATMDEEDLDNLARSATLRDPTCAAALRSRIGRAIAPVLGGRWPALTPRALLAKRASGALANA